MKWSVQVGLRVCAEVTKSNAHSPGGNLTSEMEEGQGHSGPSKGRSPLSSTQRLTW